MNKPEKETNGLKTRLIQYLDIPEFQDSDAVARFDRLVFACNPDLRALLRHCSPFEYPPDQFKQVRKSSCQLLKLVLRSSPPMALVYTRPLAERPEDFCTTLKKEPAMNEMLSKLRGGNYGNN